VGHSVCAFQDSLVIAGGGAVCFSFGSYWNRDVLTLNLGSGKAPVIWSFEGEQTPIPRSDQQFRGQPVQSVPTSLSPMRETESMRDILRLKVETSDEFMRMIHHAKPFIMEGLDLGPCQREWSLDVLKARIGPNRSVRRLHILLWPGSTDITGYGAWSHWISYGLLG
jgi:tRNA wybutosine-synthesizing protein 4